jgi:hypothetical protein
MHLYFLRAFVCLTCVAAALPAQTPVSAVRAAPPKVNARNLYNRVIAVVPMIGSGTMADPRRPKYAPWPPPKGQASTDIIGYSQIASDDGKSVIVEFVARDRAAFQAILADKSITVFEKGKDSKGDVENALRKFKADFSLDKYSMAVQ